MRKLKGMPITGANPETSMKRPFVPNAKDTSADTQTTIAEPPAPFKNKLMTAQQTTSSGASGGVSTQLTRDQSQIASGLKRSTPGARALPPGAPVGQRKQPNQTGQIGGRKSFPPPRRRAGQPTPSAYKVKRNASFYGE